MPARRRTEHAAGRHVRAALAALLLPLAAGCVNLSLTSGVPPRVERLASLVPSVSTAKEVIAALGEPQGRGATQLSVTPKAEMWVYGEVGIEGKSARQRLLFVFMDRPSGTYQGHMWFGSGHAVEKTCIVCQ